MKDTEKTFDFGQDSGRTMRHSHLGTKGELTIELHYGDFQTGHGRQAALFLWRRGHYEDGVFVPLSEMWRFGHTTAQQAVAFATFVPELTAQLYGGLLVRSDMIRVMDAVLDYLDELRRSPPDPNLMKDPSYKRWMEEMADQDMEFTRKPRMMH